MADQEEDDVREPTALERFSSFVVRNVLPVVLVPAVSVTFLGVIAWNNAERDLKDAKNWQSNHEQYHVDRGRETKEEMGAVKAQIETLRNRDGELQQKMDALAFQVAANSKSIEITAASQDKLNQSLQALTTKLEVAVEILNRLDRSRINGTKD